MGKSNIIQFPYLQKEKLIPPEQQAEYEAKLKAMSLEELVNEMCKKKGK